MMRGAIVVGTDGTGLSNSAVDWAAREAHRRRLPLRIVHVFDGNWQEAQFDIGSEYIDVARSLADALVTAAGERARQITADHTVVTDTPVGDAARRLLEVSRGGAFGAR